MKSKQLQLQVRYLFNSCLFFYSRKYFSYPTLLCYHQFIPFTATEKYVAVNMDNNGCNSGYELILDIDECKEASTDICDSGFNSYTGNWGNSLNLKKGCFIYPSWDKQSCNGVYFNNGEGSSFHDTHIHVCAAKGTVF